MTDQTMIHLSAGSELTIVHAQASQQAWLAQLGSSGDVSLNLAQVQEVDSAGVQLLLAFQASLHEASRQLTLQSPSKSVLAALDLFRLSQLQACARNGSGT